MPRAGPSDAEKARLGRNKACHQCRSKKLVGLPVPTSLQPPNLAKSLVHRNAQSEVECTFDNPEDIANGAKGLIARLESRIAELEAELAKCTCNRTTTPSAATTSDSTPPGLSLFPSPHSDSIAHLQHSPGFSQTSHSNSDDFASMLGAIPQSSPILEDTFSLHPPAENNQVLRTDWPLNVPPPDLLNHLAQAFFASCPMANSILHRPTFMANIALSPTSPDFPHVALLHAICAIGSLYTPIIEDGPSDEKRLIGHASFFHSAIYKRFLKGPNRRYHPRRIEDIVGDGNITFGEAQIRWAGAAIQVATRDGDRPLHLFQACVIAALWSYAKGEPAATFSVIGNASMFASPLGLTMAEPYAPLSRLPFVMLKLLPALKPPIETEMALRTFWVSVNFLRNQYLPNGDSSSTYAMERIYTAGVVWPLFLTDDDVSQVMPCRTTDFLSGASIPTAGRQALFTPKMLITHPPLATDSFILYIKASVLLGKVKTFNIRFKMRYPSSKLPGAEFLSSASGQDYDDPRETVEFQMLDNLIRSFISRIPNEFKDPFAQGASGIAVDPLLYSAHLVPHVSMILLHDPHADIGSPNCPSSERILTSSRAILDLIYKLSATTYDFLQLDHSCSFCWFIAGAALVRFLKVNLATGNEEAAGRLSSEVNVVKFVLTRLGERAKVGQRHLQLLDEICSLELGVQTSGLSAFGLSASLEVLE